MKRSGLLSLPVKDPRALDTHRETATVPIVATRAEPLERLERLLARQAAAEHAEELRTRGQVA